MKDVCCIDCEHCHEYWVVYDDVVEEHFTCDAGSVVKDVYDPEKTIDCADFVQFIEDI